MEESENLMAHNGVLRKGVGVGGRGEGYVQ